MLTEPSDLDRPALAELLRRHWGLRVQELEYLPVGFGSHHWRAGGRFVTADDLEATHALGPDADSAFSALEAAYRTAAVLRDEAGLEFVVAALPDAEGALLRRLDERYAVSVLPWIDGESAEWGPWERAEDRCAVAELVARLHAATPLVPAGLPRRDDLEVQARTGLEQALDDLDRPWGTGPFAEPARRALADAADRVRSRLLDYDALAARVPRDGWVVTHGEPHRANVIRTADGLRLVDWDTTLVAPRERDLFMVVDAARTGWESYAAVVPAELDEDTLRLYRAWWQLSDVAVFVMLLRRPHVDDAQTAESWSNLAENLASV